MPQVIETMRLLPMERLANAPRLVGGVCVIRGAPTPVIDTSRLFEDQSDEYERLVTVRIGERTIAFAADAVIGVQTITIDDRERLPPLLRDVDSVAAVTVLDQDLVFFLRTARIVPNDFLDGLNGDGASA
jgi:purine-binding chemotaxis protein CheW